MKQKCENCGYSVSIDESLYPSDSLIDVDCPRCHELVRFQIEHREETANEEAEANEKVAAATPAVTEEKKPRKRRKKETVVNEETQETVKPKRSRARKQLGGPDEVGNSPMSPPPVPRATRKSDVKLNNASRGYHKPPRTFSIGNLLKWIVIILLISGAYWYFFVRPERTSHAAEAADSAYAEAVDVTETEVVEAPVEEENAEAYEEGPEVTEEETATEYVSETGPFGFHIGQNYFDGDMIHTDGRRFPFKLQFSCDADGNFTAIEYLNVNSKTKLKLRLDEINYNFVRFIGRDGGKDFIIQMSGEAPNYSGDAWWGDFHQDIEMTLR